MRSKGESQNMEMEILRIQKLLSEDISDYTHSLILKFPRVERFVLCKRLEDSIANMLHLTIEAKKEVL